MLFFVFKAKKKNNDSRANQCEEGGGEGDVGGASGWRMKRRNKLSKSENEGEEREGHERRQRKEK